MSNAADLGIVQLGGNFIHASIANSYGTLDMLSSSPTNSFENDLFNTYVGLANNFQNVVAENTLDGASGQSYGGYAAAFGGAEPNNVTDRQSLLIDNEPTLPWNKDQQIYYKLRGFNNNTSTYETWIIAEEIVPRTETFDPTGNFPNIDYNVYFTPPSGNTLSNIRIVARWIQ